MRAGFIILGSAFLIVFLNLQRTFNGWGDPIFYPPAKEIKYISMGHNNTMADLFWLRTLQDFGVCDQKQKGNNLAPDGKRMGKDRTPSCSKGWMYRMLDLVMELAPKFYMAARTGPLSLSVIADDIDGATLLFEKAMLAFPNDWVIMYRAAYHYMMELEDKQRASDLFLEAFKYGAPEWTPLLAAKLQQKSGQYAVANLILQEFIKGDLQDKKNRSTAIEKIEELRLLINKKKGAD